MRIKVSSKRARRDRRGWNCPSKCPTCTHGGMGCDIQILNSQAFKNLTMICNYNQGIKFQPVKRGWEPAGRCTLITADIQGQAH